MVEPEKPLRKENHLFDAKSLHKLLYDHQSQDFKKSRRNLMVIAFIVLSVGFLGLELPNLNVFGLTLKNIPDPNRIHWIGIILIGYWYMMFEFYRKRDKDIHTLNHEIIHNEINDLESEIPLLQKEYDKLEKGGVLEKEVEMVKPPTNQPTSLPILNLRSPAKTRIKSQAEYDYENNIFQKIQDRKYAVNLSNESNNKYKPTLKWVLNVEEIELKVPRALAFLSLLLLFFWLFF